MPPSFPNVQMVLFIWWAGQPHRRVDLRYAWEVLGLHYVDIHHSGILQLLWYYVGSLDIHFQVNYLSEYQYYLHELLTSGAELIYSGIFGQGNGSALQLIWGCAGNELLLFECPPQYYYYNNYQVYTCNDHFYDIGVRCIQGSA